MNFIGEPSNTENKQKNILDNENINLQIQKLMAKVNNLSDNINNKLTSDYSDMIKNNIFVNSANDENPFRSGASTPVAPISSNSKLFDHTKGKNPFKSPQNSLNAEKSNTEATMDAVNPGNNNIVGVNPHIMFEKRASGNSVLNTIGNNSNMSTFTRSSAESVTSSAFIENSFPKYINLKNPEFKLPSQSVPYVPKTADLSGGKNSSRNIPSTSKRIFSSINKKFKASTSSAASSIADKEIHDKYSNQLQKKQTDWNNIDLKTYSGLLPWESHVELMQWIDPQPSFPPSYVKSNPQAMGTSSGVKFPVYEDDQNTNKGTAPPDYKPGIEGITIVAMKLEFLSPFDRAMMRYWKYYIMELNSTQINFYHLDEELTNDIPNFKDGRDDSCQIREKEKNNDFSSYTDMYSVVNGKKVWVSNGPGFNNAGLHHSKDKHAEEYVMSKVESRQILQKVMSKPANYLTNEKLCKSFSLQNSDFGIATDCNERAYILRIRCEMEQFLLSFSSVMDLINWSVYLSVGIGISLDIDERPYPDYRIVPIGSSRSRRRRRRNLREERRQRLLTEQEYRRNIFTSAAMMSGTSMFPSHARKNSAGTPNKSSIMKLTSRLRSGSHSSHNGPSSHDASEGRRHTLPNLTDTTLEVESSSLLELCSTIEADRRRRMSSVTSGVSSVSLAETGSGASTHGYMEGYRGEEAIDDDDDDYEYHHPHSEHYGSEAGSRRASDVTLGRAASADLPSPSPEDVRQTERENRRLMEEYTSLTIKRVLREDDIEQNPSNTFKIPNYKTSTEKPADVDRSNPASVLTHALTSIQFAPSKKKNSVLATPQKPPSKEVSTPKLRSKSSIASFTSVKKVLGPSKPTESTGKSFMNKLFGKKTEKNVEKIQPTHVSKKPVGIVKKEIKPEVKAANPTNPVSDHVESTILAEERNIMEDELLLESKENDENQDINKTNNEAKTSPPLDVTENAYEREGLQVEEAGDYIYQPQRLEVFSSVERIARARGSSISPNNPENRAQRERAASYHSQLMNHGDGSIANDGKYIWAPPTKIMTKKKYIREAIGCIKPLLENESWQGKVIATPCLAPEYETNNPPISGILEELGKMEIENARNASIFKYGFSSHENKSKPKFKLILRRCKNHYLKQSVVGPSGYVRL